MASALNRRRVGVAIGASTLLATPLGITSATAAPAPATPPGVSWENGLTQAIYNFSQAIEETLWVQVPTDTDGDGVLDRVMIQTSRPRETQTQGLKVPIVMEASPYRSGTWGSIPNHDDWRTSLELPQSIFTHKSTKGPVADLPTSLDNYYVPRGYGVVIAQSIGTAQSTGCPTTGDDAETQSAKAVIDWLNGRGVAFDAREGGKTVANPTWTTGAVGMTGASYNGTLPNQVATTGVEGLKTIVPVAAISDWYGYYRENGLVVAPGGYQGEDADVLLGYVAGQARATGHCATQYQQMYEDQDRVSGDSNAFWKARGYVDKVKDIKASVFVVHGRNDWNVKPAQYGQWWDALAKHNVARKIWLHNGGHGAPGSTSAYSLADETRWTYQQTVHRWFDHWLWGIDNGIMDEPQAIVTRENNSTNETFSSWPQPGSKDVTMSLAASSATASGTLTTAKVVPPKQATQTFTDMGREVGSTQNRPGLPMLIANPDTATGQRLAFVTEPLTSATRLSGTASVRLRMSVDDADAANLTAYLVDYAAPGTAGLETCTPANTCTMVTRAWMDVQNRVKIDQTNPIHRGQFYDFRFDLHPDDYVFAEGRRIGLVIMSSDSGNRASTNVGNWGFTFLPETGTQLSLQPGHSSLTLPIVGGAAALK